MYFNNLNINTLEIEEISSESESFESQMVLEASAIAQNAKGKDGQEGIRAFLNKEKPIFTGER